MAGKKKIIEEIKAVEEKAEEAVKKAPARAKAAAKKVEETVVAEQIEAKKTAAKAVRKTRETVKTVEKAAKMIAAGPKIVIQSPMGGNITAEEIAAKLPEGVETVFVRVDQNKLWWIKGEEIGSVDIW